MWRRRVGALLLQSPLASSSTAASSCQRRRHHLLPSEVGFLPPLAHSVERVSCAPHPLFPRRFILFGSVLPGTSCSQSSCQALHIPGCKFVCSRVPKHRKTCIATCSSRELRIHWWNLFCLQGSDGGDTQKPFIAFVLGINLPFFFFLTSLLPKSYRV